MLWHPLHARRPQDQVVGQDSGILCRRWAFGAPRSVGHPGVGMLSPSIFGQVEMRGRVVITSSFPQVGQSGTQEPCQGEEATCLSRNAGSVGDVLLAFQRGRGTHECEEFLGSPTAVWKGVCVSVHLLYQLLPNKPQVPKSLAHPSLCSAPALPPVSLTLPLSHLCRPPGLYPALGYWVSRVLFAHHSTHSP